MIAKAKYKEKATERFERFDCWKRNRTGIHHSGGLIILLEKRHNRTNGVALCSSDVRNLDHGLSMICKAAQAPARRSFIISA